MPQADRLEDPRNGRCTAGHGAYAFASVDVAKRTPQAGRAIPVGVGL